MPIDKSHQQHGEQRTRTDDERRIGGGGEEHGGILGQEIDRPAAQAQEQQQALDQQEQQHTAALAAKDQEIANLRAELEALKKAPGASTSQVVETEKKDKPEDKPSAVEDFFETRKRATALYNLIP